jgi:hypothetical protein
MPQISEFWKEPRREVHNAKWTGKVLADLLL